MLLNLAGNAIVHRARLVRIVASHRELGGESSNSHRGDRQRHRHLAEVQTVHPFTRWTINLPHGGTGWPAISKQLCSDGRHHGADSEPGCGSVLVHGECRRGAAPAVSAPQIQPVIESARKPRSVAEDNPMIRMISKLLKKGHAAEMVVNGKEVAAVQRASTISC